MLLGKLIQIYMAYERILFLERRASDAQRAASRHDWRGLYSIVRSLGGASPSSVPRPVRQLNGELTTNETERQRRWQEHFKDVFRGRSVTMDELRARPREPRSRPPTPWRRRIL